MRWACGLSSTSRMRLMAWRKAIPLLAKRWPVGRIGRARRRRAPAAWPSWRRPSRPSSGLRLPRPASSPPRPAAAYCISCMMAICRFCCTWIFCFSFWICACSRLRSDSCCASVLVLPLGAVTVRAASASGATCGLAEGAAGPVAASPAAGRSPPGPCRREPERRHRESCSNERRDACR